MKEETVIKQNDAKSILASIRRLKRRPIRKYTAANILADAERSWGYEQKRSTP